MFAISIFYCLYWNLCNWIRRCVHKIGSADFKEFHFIVCIPIESQCYASLLFTWTRAKLSSSTPIRTILFVKGENYSKPFNDYFPCSCNRCDLSPARDQTPFPLTRRKRNGEGYKISCNVYGYTESLMQLLSCKLKEFLNYNCYSWLIMMTYLYYFIT